MDWYSRYVLEWELSNTLESDFCVRALRRALKKYAQPQISNTDQGVQFTSAVWTDVNRALDRYQHGRSWQSL